LLDGAQQRSSSLWIAAWTGFCKGEIGWNPRSPSIRIFVLTQSMFPEKPQVHLDFHLSEKGGQVSAAPNSPHGVRRKPGGEPRKS
jgi:hypothetical protein